MKQKKIIDIHKKTAQIYTETAQKLHKLNKIATNPLFKAMIVV
jgi:hypothetical protein